jgi:hypothetical protein
LLKTVTDDGDHEIARGHLIQLDADVRDIVERSSYKHKYWGDNDIKELSDNIAEVYKSIDKTVICTRGRSVNDVAREIAKVVYLGEYVEVDIGAELKSFQK